MNLNILNKKTHSYKLGLIFQLIEIRGCAVTYIIHTIIIVYSFAILKIILCLKETTKNESNRNQILVDPVHECS